MNTVIEIVIEILEKQSEWVKNNRDLCPHSDEYYEGYKEGTAHCLGLLEKAKKKFKATKAILG